MGPCSVGQFSSIQEEMWQRIFSLPREERANQLLKWALARIEFYGPSDEPCAQAIRIYLSAQ